MHHRLVAGLMGVCMLVGCTHTVSFDMPGSLHVPQKIRAQVDPRLWALQEQWSTREGLRTADVGQALRYLLEDDLLAGMEVRYVTSQVTETTTGRNAIGLTFYDPDLNRAVYHITVLWGRTTPLMMVEGIGEGRSGATAVRAGRAAIEAGLLDLYRKLTALAVHDDAR